MATATRTPLNHPTSLSEQQHDPKPGGVLSENNKVVNSKTNKNKKATMGWFPNCCGVAPSAKGSLESDTVNDSSLSPSFLVLDGFEIISLGKVGANRQEAGNVFFEQAQERWQQRVESHVSIGNVSYEYKTTTTPQTELVKAAYDLAKNSSKTVGEAHSVTQTLICKPMKSGESLPEKQAALLQLIKNDQHAMAMNQLCDIIDEDQEKRGAEDLVVTMELKNRAILHLMCGQKEQAMYFFHEYLLSKKQCFGEKSTLLSDSLNELGIVMYARGDKNGALCMLHEALELYGDDFWYSDDPMVPAILNNLGCAHYSRGDPGKGISFLQKALVVQRMALLEATVKSESALFHHAITKLNIGHVHLASGNLKALPMLEDSLTQLEELFGDVNATVDSVQENIRVCKALMQERSTKQDTEPGKLAEQERRAQEDAEPEKLSENK